MFFVAFKHDDTLI